MHSLQLVVLGSGELLVRDDAVLVLVLVGKDLLDQLVLVLQHLACLLALLTACTLHRLNLQYYTVSTTIPSKLAPIRSNSTVDN